VCGSPAVCAQAREARTHAAPSFQDAHVGLASEKCRAACMHASCMLVG
jgi:hypothetical protein